MLFQLSRIQGGPGWLDEERYDVLAKAGNPEVSRDEVRLMLQSLLADRFKLAFHRETKQSLVYPQLVGKNGPKLKDSKDDEKTNISNSAEPGGRRVIVFQKWSMQGQCVTLGGLFGSPVLNKTGLPGTYDFKLAYEPDSNPVAGNAEPPQLNGGPVDSEPSLVTAIEELGLKLEAGKGPVEEMVIDYVNRASKN